MQFEINGEVYFLNFAEEQGKWFVVKPTATGVQAIPVYVDSAKYERFGIMGKDRQIQN